jgi:hypothetical protein
MPDEAWKKLPKEIPGPLKYPCAEDNALNEGSFYAKLCIPVHFHLHEINPIAFNKIRNSILHF